MTKTGSRERLYLEGQLTHFVCAAILLLALYAASGAHGFGLGSFLRLSTATWAILAVINAIAHQVYVWLCWRAELHGQHLTRIFGDQSFRIYQIGFAILIVLRPVRMSTRAISSRLRT